MENQKWQTGRPNMHKAPRLSQLSKTDTGALERNGLTRPERARSGDLTWHARPNDATWEQTENGPPERAQGTRAVTT